MKRVRSVNDERADNSNDVCTSWLQDYYLFTQYRLFRMKSGDQAQVIFTTETPGF